MYLYSQLCAAQTQIGSVIVTAGTVTATGSDNRQRTLSRRSPLYVGDTVVTGADSNAQLRFTDDTIVALAANSSFRVRNYDYQPKKKQKSKYAATLNRGALQTLTGAIGKSDPEAYTISTNIATIGVRGTFIETALTATGQDIAVLSGTVIFTTVAGGSILLGPQQRFQFAHASPGGAAPVGLPQEPESLTAALDKKAPMIIAQARRIGPQFPPPLTIGSYHGTDIIGNPFQLTPDLRMNIIPLPPPPPPPA